MIRNIIDNAISYSHPHSTVNVTLISQSPTLLLRVEDHGPGIPPELRARIFERFFRGLGHQAPGSGLGLAIVDQIVSLHHGSIRLSTPQDGKSGLCFDVTLPMPAP